MNIRLSVIIPCKNEEEHIEACLRSVLAVCTPAPEILVVDSYSNDTTVPKALGYPAQVLRLLPDWPHSPAAGRFIGAVRARGEFLFFLDADMTLEAGFLEKAVAHLEANPSCAGVGGIGRELYLDESGSRTGLNPDLYRRAGAQRAVAFLGGAALYRRSALLEAGNFNPYLAAAEELELSRRLRRKGYSLMSLPEPMITHYTRTIADWAEFKRKRNAGFYRGIGQSLRLCGGVSFLIEHLLYYRQFSAFLALMLLLCVSRFAALAVLLALLLILCVRKRSCAAGVRSVVKWLLMCLDILRGVLTPLPRSREYPTDAEVMTRENFSRYPRTIVCLSPIDWDFLRQRHQLFMSYFAGQGARVIYVENMHPVPHLSLSLLWRALRRLSRISSQVKPGQEEPNITVVTPLVIPSQCSWAARLNQNLFNAILARRIRSIGIRRPCLVWTYCATKAAADLISRLAPDSLLYDCVSDASLHPDSPSDIAQSERALVRRADIVLTDNSCHLEKFRPLTPRIRLVWPGVDDIMFAPSASPGPGVGPAIGSPAAPKLCFFGGINDLRMDFDLIRAVALARPAWSIILLGPVVKSDIRRLKLPNILFAGTVSRTELAGRLQEMDCLIMPYKLTGFCSSVFPAKTFECLATGKPVVATPLPELKQFSPFIALAGTAEQFVFMIEETLAHDTPQLREQRLALAHHHSWTERFQRVREILEETLR